MNNHNLLFLGHVHGHINRTNRENWVNEAFAICGIAMAVLPRLAIPPSTPFQMPTMLIWRIKTVEQESSVYTMAYRGLVFVALKFN